MNNITELIEGLEAIESSLGHNCVESKRVLSQTISILKSIDSGGKLVPEEKKQDHITPARDRDVKIWNMCRQQVLINRVSALERLPGVILNSKLVQAIKSILELITDSPEELAKVIIVLEKQVNEIVTKITEEF